MDKFFTVRLELTYEDAHKLYTTYVDYCSPNQNVTLLSIADEPHFIMAVEEARVQAGFPYCCVLVGIRNLGRIRE